ncbi:hypothetical protein ACFP81_00360 [Deinococcus lacus]|uniref:Uncharacterized protein n=1 Tax=Deinococcus lacus TaxID=392561 RepID=A0ABW1Y8J2_9DEIO
MNEPTQKGVRGFDLDIHLAFREPLEREVALELLRELEGYTAELYAPHHIPGAAVPSARVTGPLRSPQDVQRALEAWLPHATYIEAGLRGFLRSASGSTDWVPWRRNLVLTRGQVDQVRFEEGVKYILE